MKPIQIDERPRHEMEPTIDETLLTIVSLPWQDMQSEWEYRGEALSEIDPLEMKQFEWFYPNPRIK